MAAVCSFRRVFLIFSSCGLRCNSSYIMNYTEWTDIGLWNAYDRKLIHTRPERRILYILSDRPPHSQFLPPYNCRFLGDKREFSQICHGDRRNFPPSPKLECQGRRVYDFHTAAEFFSTLPPRIFVSVKILQTKRLTHGIIVPVKFLFFYLNVFTVSTNRCVATIYNLKLNFFIPKQ